MPKFDTTYQAYRREQLHRFSNMDPDDIICELNVDTDLLMDVLWFKIEEYIETNYEDETDGDKEDDDEG